MAVAPRRWPVASGEDTASVPDDEGVSLGSGDGAPAGAEFDCRAAQPTLSGIENGNDPMLSTLRNVVEGLGGRLEVIAVFENLRFRLALGESPTP